MHIYEYPCINFINAPDSHHVHYLNLPYILNTVFFMFYLQ